MIGIYARDSVTWLRASARDELGEPGVPTEIPIKARVLWDYRRVTNEAGEEITAAGMVQMKSRPTPETDRLRIDGRLHLIVAVKEKKAFGRTYYYMVFIQ